MIEDVKKIILHYLGGSSYAGMWDDCTKQICQLFEPKPSKTGLPSIQLGNENSPFITDKDKFSKAPNFVMGKPDEGRLLTEEEIRAIPFYKLTPQDALPYELAKAQRDLTASIKDAECQERVERILDGLEKPCNCGQPECYANTWDKAIQTMRQALKKKEK